MFYEAKSARLVICERTGRWAVALRRELAGAGLRIWETRSLTDCEEMLAESPASFVVLELSKQKNEEIFKYISNWERVFPLFRFAIVADRGLVSYRWLMQEAGATDFLTSIRKIGEIAQIACRHLAQVPPVPQNLTERIWANLPWSRVAEKA
jgi:hypothetical protein